MLIVTLPMGDRRSAALVGTFEWLIAMLAGGPLTIALDVADQVRLDLGAGEHELLWIPARSIPQTIDTIQIVPGLALEAAAGAGTAEFLQARSRGLNHVGINLSAQDVSEAGWARLIFAVAAAAPAYRLNVSSPNDIVVIVSENQLGQSSVVELVHDRVADWSSVHVCLSVAATRAELERQFPEPIGAYKPGDAAFFRSIALPSSLALPAYIDLAYSDGALPPWPQVVATMGQRIG